LLGILYEMSEPTREEWVQLTERIARSVQTTIGWIFWDPGAVRRYEARGLAPGLGYIAARCAPFAGAGSKAVQAAFGSISELGIDVVFKLLPAKENFLDVWRDRNDAVLEGLNDYAPEMLMALEEWGPRLWSIIPDLPLSGRPFAASHLNLEVLDHPVLSGWHAVNFLREWRGDTHWDIVTSKGLSGGEVSILHNAWLGYDGDWLSLSRGNSPESIAASWRGLERKGLASENEVNAQGIALRQVIEDETNAFTSLPWELLGFNDTVSLATRLEPSCEKLLARVDETAGVRYQPASRPRPREATS
jgi:hypothetical protein